jgi:hypothetical protein
LSRKSGAEPRPASGLAVVRPNMDAFRSALAKSRQASRDAPSDRVWAEWWSSQSLAEAAGELGDEPISSGDTDDAELLSFPCPRTGAQLLFVSGGAASRVSGGAAAEPQLLLIGGVRSNDGSGPQAPAGKNIETGVAKKMVEFGDGAHLGDVWAFSLTEVGAARPWTCLSDGDPAKYGKLGALSPAARTAAATDTKDANKSSSSSSSDDDEDEGMSKASAAKAAARRKRRRRVGKAGKKMSKPHDERDAKDHGATLDEALSTAATMEEVMSSIAELEAEEVVAQLMLKCAQLMPSKETNLNAGTDAARAQARAARKEAFDPFYRVARAGHSCVLHESPARDGEVQVFLFGGKSR